MFWSQVINGLLLPIVLVIILMLVNNRMLMGRYVNSRTYNVVCWVSVVALALISIAYVVSQFVVR
ncbi:MAG TPA: Mn transporter, partial [Syntrophobacteraceae bacterium]|nr:Mn transporter [Syntrophobacteraceae bacterium]